MHVVWYCLHVLSGHSVKCTRLCRALSHGVHWAMTTNATQLISGVDHLTALSLFLLFCLLSHLPSGTSMPTRDYTHPDAGDSLKGGRFPFDTKKPVADTVFIANSMLLQIMPDGTIEGTKCRSSRYAMLQRMSHHIGPRNKQVITIKGVETERHLCMDNTGHLYASEPNSFNEADCSFTFKEQWIQSNETSYNNNKTVFRLSRLRHHKNRYYVGLYCDGRPIVAKDCRQRRKLRKHLLFTVGDFNPDENAGTCSAIKPPKCKRTYLKFCRKVVQNFFSVSVKEWKKFRAKKCFKRLGREKQRMRKIAEKCNGWSSRPRHPTWDYV